MRDGISDVLHTTSLPSSSYVVQVGTLLKILDQCINITSKGFALSMVKGQHL